MDPLWIHPENRVCDVSPANNYLEVFMARYRRRGRRRGRRGFRRGYFRRRGGIRL